MIRIANPERFLWHEVKKVDHYWLSVDAMREPLKVREEPPGSGQAS
jgi:hypothetical protein